jgi:hypothetical protein
MKINRILWTPILAILAFVGSAKAQATPPAYRPGETIRISVTFDGPDAEKITSADMVVQLGSPLEPKQTNFNTGFSGSSNKTGPKTFEISYKVSDGLASGEYKLVQISAVVAFSQNGRVSFSYPLAELPSITFKIENPNTVTKPELKGVTVLPKS